jgi:hypothetical protein
MIRASLDLIRFRRSSQAERRVESNFHTLNIDVDKIAGLLNLTIRQSDAFVNLIESPNVVGVVFIRIFFELIGREFILYFDGFFNQFPWIRTARQDKVCNDEFRVDMLDHAGGRTVFAASEKAAATLFRGGHVVRQVSHVQARRFDMGMGFLLHTSPRSRNRL